MSRVYLVGAGPGDPGLLTQKAVELLRTADIVAYDELISPAILNLVGPEAEMIPVGYRARGSAKPTYRMHPVVIERARAGKIVVRLKSGDPLIFGRAVQECEELIENRIPFEIVPGITSGLGAAAYAGIALTDRESVSDLIIATGHDLRGGVASKSNWEALGKSTGTLLIYMAGSKIAENCARLIELGRKADCPAAYISDASRASQKVITGTLTTLPGLIPPSASSPALMIVGEGVSRRDSLSWFEEKPLYDIRVLLVRARSGESQFARELAARGASVIEAPFVTTETLESDERAGLDRAIENLASASNLIFSCEEGISYFFRRMSELGKDARSLSTQRIVAMGPRVREALLRHGIRADLEMEGHCFEAVERHSRELRTGRCVVIASSRGRGGLRAFLERLEIPVEIVSAYRYRHRFPKIAAPQVDYVVVPSSTSAELLLDGPWREAMLSTPMIALGPITREAALRLGASTVHQTETDRLESLLKLLARLKETRQ